MSLISSQRALWLSRHVLPCEPALRGWLIRRPNLPADVDDIVQETYAILAGLAEVDHIQNPRAYMFEVAKSVILQTVRRRRVVTFEALIETDGLEIPDLTPSPETIAADRQELGRLAALIAGLPVRCREAFTLRKVQGLSQREVALRMGVSENTVEKHIGKSIALLMAEMGRGGNRRAKASYEGEVEKQHTRRGPARDQRGHR